MTYCISILLLQQEIQIASYLYYVGIVDFIRI